MHSRRGFFKIAGLGAAHLVMNHSVMAKAESHARPNIILCMADDQGWGEMGYYGHPHLKTPTFDRMAANGLRFDRFYAAAPVCSPTRASVMTGRHPNRSGVFLWNYAIRPEEITIAALLKDAGYRTGHFGKWHLGPVKADSKVNPRACGFEQYLSHDNFFELDPPLSRNGADPEIHKGESSEIVVTEAVKFINKARGENKPFFVVIWFGSPHGPYRGLKRDTTLYAGTESNERRHRYAEITAMDRAMGQLRSALRQLEVAKDTLLWYCSDNGIPRQMRPTADLRGSKGNLYEGGIRVPAIIEWPALVREPKVTKIPCVTSDIMPTILDLIGLKAPNRPLDGISLRRLIEGNMSERPQPIGFWQYRHKAEQNNELWMDADSLKGTTPTATRASIQFLNFRHPKPLTKDFPGPAAWMDNRYKIVTNGRKTELFDIVADSLEKQDLAAHKPQVTAKMKAQLEAWQGSVEQSLAGRDY
ncbi:MAG: sulfatase-like hydrolase/transferase [Phycisphaerales bacterium]|nr:MAG: sulfatase-like hydrolase/transferase [Phycisphaerales bacterium]